MSLLDLLAALRRRRFTLIFCLLAGLAGGIYHGNATPKSYVATSNSVISVPAVGGIQDSLAGAQLSQQLLGTYARVAASRAVAERMIASLGLPETPDALRGKISAAVEDNTFLIDISVSDGDPQRAASLANAAANALSAELANLETGKANPVQAHLLDRAAVPGVPASPRPKRDLLAGLALGVLAGAGALLLLETADRSIKLPQQGTDSFRAPLLGVIPRKRGGLGLVSAVDPSGVEAEAIRVIRTGLQFVDPDSPLRIVLITSPSQSSGKTSLCANLGISLASSGVRVLIVDADLRKAALTQLLGLERVVGVSTVVARTSQIDETIQRWGDRLDVLPAGIEPPNSAELLGSQSMALLLESLTSHYDLILLDGPPVLPVTDAVVLSAQVDGVIVVARYGKTTRSGAAETARRLHTVGAQILGHVLNAVPPNESHYYYTGAGYKARAAAIPLPIAE